MLLGKDNVNTETCLILAKKKLSKIIEHCKFDIYWVLLGIAYV